MSANDKGFKKPPKKHMPKGITVLYEDRDIIVVDKVHGLLTVGNEKERENTVYYRLNNYVRKGNQKSRNRVFVVHRLDRDTSGILVFAKSEKAKRFLQEEWSNFKKHYLTVVHGNFEEKEGEISTYLKENKVHKVYSVKDPSKGKEAKTGYCVLEENRRYSLVEVDLITGRKNQIRVHFSEAGHPVVGDKKYGEIQKGFKRLALHSSSLSIKHPFTKEEMTFKAKTPSYFKELMK